MRCMRQSGQPAPVRDDALRILLGEYARGRFCRQLGLDRAAAADDDAERRHRRRCSSVVGSRAA